MTAKPESALIKRILKVLRDKGGFWFKVHGGPYQVTGLPDIIGCYKGRFYGFEVKISRDAKPTARQALTLSLIKRAGGVSLVVRGPTDALKAMRKGRIADNRELFPGKAWLTASQSCAKLGLEMGDRPISRWKLNKMIKEGSISYRKYGSRVYCSVVSINRFLHKE